MALYDVRCKDVARILSTNVKTMDEIGDAIHSLHPSIDPRGTWVRDILIMWNSLVTRGNVGFKLSNLGRAIISLPGSEGNEVTPEEKVFLLGVMMLDNQQRRIASELMTIGNSSDRDEFVVNQTSKVLKQLSFL